MTATATAPHPMIPQSNVILPDTKLRSTPRFVFFAGDNITMQEKYAAPSRFMGGVELDMYLTLRETGKELYARSDLYNTGGVLYRCAIHQLKTAYLPVNKQMVSPADREGGTLLPGYQVQNGRRNHKTGQYEDVTVTNDNMVYRPFYPGDEIESMTRPSTGLRPGGIVEITALHGKTWQEQVDAQLHYFPNWEQLQTGEESLPATIRELRDNIAARVLVADTAELKSIGRDMLRSCDEFKVWGLRYLKAWRQTVKFADNQIDSPIAGYNELAEMLFEMLQVAREDTLNQTGNVADIATQIGQSIAAAIAQGMSPQQAAQAVEIAPAAKVDPMEGLDLVDGQPGEVIPDETAADEGAGKSFAESITVPENIWSGPDTGDTTGSRVEAVIKVSDKVTIMVDGLEREGLVTWKGPNNKIKLAFEDGSTVMVDKSEVIAN